jgi:hypothetical protein
MTDNKPDWEEEFIKWYYDVPFKSERVNPELIISYFKRYVFSQPKDDKGVLRWVKADSIVKELALWSKKYPRGTMYSANNQPKMDGELIAIEDMAIKYLEEIPSKEPVKEEQESEVSFELEDIEDARIIIVVKGKHYSIISTGDKEEGRTYRVALVQTLLSMQGQIIVTPSLEEIKLQQ